VDEIAPGLWRWTAPHPEWKPDVEWGREVASFAFAVDETLVLVDPLVRDEAAQRLVAAADRARRAAAGKCGGVHDRPAARAAALVPVAP
jgi:hypothetical protein